MNSNAFVDRSVPSPNGLGDNDQTIGDVSSEAWSKRVSLPILSNDHEIQFFIRYEAGDQLAFETLVERNLRLVISVSSRLLNRGLSRQDLVQEGTIGLMVAIEKFDYRRGNKFSTYAVWWIRQAMVRAISSTSRIITLPYRTVEKHWRLTHIQDVLTQELDHEPTLKEIVKTYNQRYSDELTAREATEFLLVPICDLSIDNFLDEDSLFQDVPEDTEHTNPARRIEHDIAPAISVMRGILSDREFIVIVLRLGLYDDKAWQRKELAQSLRICPETVKNSETRALKKLQESSHRFDYLLN